MKVQQQDLAIDAISIKRAALIVRALNHPFRQKILRLIHEEEALNVTQLQDLLEELQPVVSMHLGLLREAGIVDVYRDGKTRWYSLNYEYLDKVYGSVSRLRKGVS